MFPEACHIPRRTIHQTALQPDSVGNSVMTNSRCQPPVPCGLFFAVPHYLVFNDNTVSSPRSADTTADCQGPIRGKIETLLFSNSLKQHQPRVPIIIVQSHRLRADT